MLKFKAKSLKDNQEKVNINVDDQGRIGIKDIVPTAQLDINGNVRVRNLGNEELIKAKEIKDLRPLVSDQEGNVFNLPYEASKDEDHFIIPVLRSGGRYLKADGTKSFEIKNLFKPYDFNGGRHLIEIKLLLRSSESNPIKNGSFKINYIDGYLEVVYQSGKADKPDSNKESLSFEEHKLTLEIVENQADRDIFIKYSGSGNNWCNVKYFITRYVTF